MVAGLDTEVRGQGHRLALIHGFTQNRRCWGPFADLLAERLEVVLVDAPGHGGSADRTADVTAGAALIGDTVGRASYLGYSMGGRHALRLALDQPQLVDRLVLIGASPGIADARGRQARREADDILAARLESIGVDAFLDEWLAQSIFAGVPGAARFVTERRTNTADGLAASLRLAGTGAQEPLWNRLAELAAPTLLVVGAQDHKFHDVASRMQEGIGANAALVAIPSAGHAPQLERPDATATAIADWLLGEG